MHLSDEDVAKLHRVDQWFQGWSPPPGITHRISRDESRQMVSVHLRRMADEIVTDDVEIWGRDLWDVEDPLPVAQEMVNKAVEQLEAQSG